MNQKSCQNLIDSANYALVWYDKNDYICHPAMRHSFEGGAVAMIAITIFLLGMAIGMGLRE